MRKFFGAIGLLVLLGGVLVFVFDQPAETAQVKHERKVVPADYDDDPGTRWEWQKQRLADPVTGEIPANMRARELAFARALPNDAALARQGGETYEWTHLGPYNIGGRTRALAIDVNNEDIMLAGGVSGGIWRTTDGGQSWSKATQPQQHHSITCIAQDRRTGQTDTWYYGSGEVRGNSASKSFSAFYSGNGVYKSTDNGQSWQSLVATADTMPQETGTWDRIWDIATDPANTQEDVVYVAAVGSLMRTTDGGTSWTEVLGGQLADSYYTDIEVASDGTAYATFSSDGSTKGIWRSTDGVSWTNITANTWPGTYERIVAGIDPGNENVVWFVAETPGSGQVHNVNSNEPENHSLWKYTYVSGDGTGAGGMWENLSANLPTDTFNTSTFRSQDSYNLCIAVHPEDSNTVYIGGTSIFRSTNGWSTPESYTQMGGYKRDTEGPWGYRLENHHPDQHAFLFLPSNPDVMINGNDGGVYRTEDCRADSVLWTPLNNGYLTTQFYTVGIDHGTPESNVVFGGLQDNGTQWTNSDDPTHAWTSPNWGDGSFCAAEDGGGMYYFSRQFGRIIKAQVDQNGELAGYQRIDPEGGSNYRFVNPFVLDPSDQHVMYLSEGFSIWRNDDLSAIPLNDEYEKISTNWTELTNMTANNVITAMAVSHTPGHRLYYGTASKNIYRIDNANAGQPWAENITGNILFGGYTSCIAVDPRNADVVLVVYSNYNTYSLYFSDNGGNSWEGVGGNLEAEQPDGAPQWLGSGDGPSVRWASIIPVDNGTVFLLGTSVGMFATSQLDGDSTVWVQQATNSIGNVVCDMIDYRQSDGFVAVGTHGTGVFTTNITETWGITGQEDLLPAGSAALELWPNPANNQLTLELHAQEAGPAQLSIYDVSGTLVLARQLVSASGIVRETLDVSTLKSGAYFVVAESESGRAVRKLVVD